MRQYALKDTETGKYFPHGQVTWPFVDNLSDARIFASEEAALQAKHADVTRAKEREKDPHNEIPDIENLNVQPIGIREL